MGQTIVEKIAQKHMTEGSVAAAADGGFPVDSSAPLHDA